MHDNGNYDYSFMPMNDTRTGVGDNLKGSRL
jgi:hypothetical protein